MDREGEGAFPSVTVNPGDYIIADIDGVVCVPAKLSDEVADRCGKAREIDEKVVEEINAGMSIKDALKKWRG
jgi:regulator of RNase E activity RraA